MPSYGGGFLSKAEAQAHARLLRGLPPVTDALVELNEQSLRHYSVRVHWDKGDGFGERARYLDSPEAVAWAIMEILGDAL